MDRGIEKSSTGDSRLPAGMSVFDALAIASVLVILAGALLSVFQASWRIRAYFSIVAVIFDVILAYEFMLRLASRREPVPWLDGISTIVPLLMVSGPFIFGWIAADFRAAAVRGFWLSEPPLSSMAFIVVLRMLRVLRFNNIAPHYPAHGDGRRKSAWTAAASTGLLVIIAGALASDAFFLPGIANFAVDRRASLASTILTAPEDAARQAAAKTAGILALEVEGRTLVAASGYVHPSDYKTFMVNGAMLWFPVAEEVRARALAAAIAALASLAAALAFRIVASGSVKRLHQGSGVWKKRSRSKEDPETPPHRFRDAPTGGEELAGILGKRPR